MILERYYSDLETVTMLRSQCEMENCVACDCNSVKLYSHSDKPGSETMKMKMIILGVSKWRMI